MFQYGVLHRTGVGLEKFEGLADGCVMFVEPGFIDSAGKFAHQVEAEFGGFLLRCVGHGGFGDQSGKQEGAPCFGQFR